MVTHHHPCALGLLVASQPSCVVTAGMGAGVCMRNTRSPPDRPVLRPLPTPASPKEGIPMTDETPTRREELERLRVTLVAAIAGAGARELGLVEPGSYVRSSP